MNNFRPYPLIYAMRLPVIKGAWRNLIMANYEIDPNMLQPYVPAGTELDFYKGKCYITLAGFMFNDVRIGGLYIPFNINFEEINLRFYVRRYNAHTGEWKRGTVFLREIVPRSFIASSANILYKEKYMVLPTRHYQSTSGDTKEVEYAWKVSGHWNYMRVKTDRQAILLEPGSLEEFIAMKLWGFTRISNHKSIEYSVRHPRWKIYPVKQFDIRCSIGPLFGKKFAEVLRGRPASVFLADGSQTMLSIWSPFGSAR